MNNFGKNDKEYGYINTYDPIKGFGFIRRKKGKDLFFHYSNLETPEELIGEGDNVVFSIEKTGKGFRAIDIVKTT